MAERKLDYNVPSNSFAQSQPVQQLPAPVTPGKKELPKFDKVVNSAATLKQPTKTEQRLETGKNAVKSVMENTIKPSLKDMVLNALWTGLSLIFFPDGSRRPSGGGWAPASRVTYYGNSQYNSYSSYYRSPAAQPTVASANEPIFRNPILATPQEANAVIDAMRDCIMQYGFANWATLYDLSGMDSNNWAGTTKYGWTSVNGFMVGTVHLPDGRMGYEIRTPKSSPIEDTN